MSDDKKQIGLQGATILSSDEVDILNKYRDRFDKPIPTPTYPSMTMPESPNVAHNKNGPLPDCEGHISVYPDVSQSPVPDPLVGKIRILVGIPMLDVKYEFFESFMKFWTRCIIETSKPDCKIEIGFHVAYRKPVHMAEEYLVRTAQYNKCTHILFMDDDIYDVTWEDLLKLVNADKDVIGGVMHASKFPHAMCVFRRFNPSLKVIDMPADTSMYRLYEVPASCPHCNIAQSHWDIKFCPSCGKQIDILIQQADLIPFAFTLMKLSIFDKLKQPWFHCTSKYPTDSWFGDRLIEAGLTEYGHMGVRLNHAGITDATKPHYLQMGMLKAQQAKGVVEISPEDMERHQRLLYNKMAETESRMRSKPVFSGNPQSITQDQPAEGQTLVTHGL
mgnify:CR=1 FL=1